MYQHASYRAHVENGGNMWYHNFTCIHIGFTSGLIVSHRTLHLHMWSERLHIPSCMDHTTRTFKNKMCKIHVSLVQNMCSMYFICDVSMCATSHAQVKCGFLWGVTPTTQSSSIGMVCYWAKREKMSGKTNEQEKGEKAVAYGKKRDGQSIWQMSLSLFSQEEKWKGQAR